MNIIDLNFDYIDSVTELYVNSVQKHFKNTISDDELVNWKYDSEKNEFINNLNSKNFLIRVLIDKNNLVIGFTRFGNDEEIKELGWIDLIFIKDQYQNKGYGKLLFNDAKKIMSENGFKKIHLWTPSLGKSHGFYTKIEGKLSGEKINDIGFRLTEYSWDI